MEGRRRVTLYDQMSAVGSSRDSLAGLTLDDVLGNQKTAATPSPELRSRTLLDIIREDDSNKKDKLSWKAFKDKLLLKRAGSAWYSSIPIPTSDIPIPNQNNRNSRRNLAGVQGHSNSGVSTRYMAHQPNDPAQTRQGSTLDAANFGDPSENSTKLGPQMSRYDSTRMASGADSSRQDRGATFRDCFDSEDDGSNDDDPDPEREGTRRLSTAIAEDRALSAREAVAAQEAAEEAAAAEVAAAAAAAEEEGEEPVRMSLMDLLEETDRQMGFEGSRYRVGDGEDFGDDDDEGELEAEEEEGRVESNCCVCMVRHKGAAFIPCGHTFCRLCSRELWVSRGICPLCNNFILEILDIF